MSDRTALIVFSKNMVQGRVKTRLAATMGEVAALEIYKELVSITLGQVNQVPFEVFMYYSDFVPEEEMIGKYQAKIQSGEDLGEKMKNAFEEVFELGYEKALIIGTDCPSLTSQILQKAVDDLIVNDLVIGPAEDGGYYLLGMKACHPALFSGIEWSTSQVMIETLKRAKSLQLNVGFLARLSDVDTEADWNRFQRNRAKV